MRSTEKWNDCHIVKSSLYSSNIYQFCKEKYIIVIVDETSNNKINKRMDKLRNCCKHLMIFKEFEKFRLKYPFLCCFNNIKVKGMNSSLITYPSEIIDNEIYLGNAIHSGNKKILKDLKITHIINVSRLMTNTFENDISMNIIYYRIPIGDTLKEQIDKYFESTYVYINAVLQNTKDARILIHCQHGISRSASILISYLMKQNKCSLKDGLQFVKRRRSINPNKNFMQKLSKWEIICK